MTLRNVATSRRLQPTKPKFNSSRPAGLQFYYEVL